MDRAHSPLGLVGISFTCFLDDKRRDMREEISGEPRPELLSGLLAAGYDDVTAGSPSSSHFDEGKMRTALNFDICLHFQGDPPYNSMRIAGK